MPLCNKRKEEKRKANKAIVQKIADYYLLQLLVNLKHVGYNLKVYIIFLYFI